MIDVDDEIADLQIAQIGEKRLRRRRGAAPARAAPLRRRRPRRRSGGRRPADGNRARDCRSRRAPPRTARPPRVRPESRRSRIPSAARSCARRGPASPPRTASSRPRSRAGGGSPPPSRRRGLSARSWADSEFLWAEQARPYATGGSATRLRLGPYADIAWLLCRGRACSALVIRIHQPQLRQRRRRREARGDHRPSPAKSSAGGRTRSSRPTASS